jgi:hypothetical protein
MRISSLRAVLILACAALVVTAGACQACALFLNLLPADIFSGSRAQQIQPAGNGQNNFFSMAMGMIPASDGTSRQQMSGLLGIKKSYDNSDLELPSTSSGDNWMGNLMSSGTSVDLSNNTARSSYDQFIKRFANQSNIFTY